MAPTTSNGSLFISTMSALSIATSVPAPIAKPTSAWVKAGASFTPSPTIAALAMSGSSGLVAINALMLKRTKLTGIRRQYATASPVVVGPALAAS